MTGYVQKRSAPVGKVLAVAIGVLGIFWLAASNSTSASDPEPVRRVVVPAPPPPVSVYDTLASGETLAEMLADQGFDGASIHQLTQVVREFKNPRTLRPGLVAQFIGLPDSGPQSVLLQVNADSLLELDLIDSVWTGSVRTVPVIIDTLHLAGLIESSLWFATLSGDLHKLGEGEFQEYVYDLADNVFGWKVDFTRDIRRGDAFRVAVERQRRPDGSLRSSRFLAIELMTRGKLLQAIPFTRPEGHLEYFDAEGSAMRGTFLRYPVSFRVTSSFSRRRYHPILKVRRPHLGTDYGAPRGTPVSVTAAGTVTRAGTWGGYGRMVEVRHARGIVTRYAHLSRINVRTGAFVEQGQTIGRVGSTGLATAAHLHYEFLQNGSQKNPATIDLPSAPELEAEFMEDFGWTRDRALAELNQVALPVLTDNSRVASVVAD
ncbi:MAG: M23 family metallopeptidase [Gemmatimonadota bacterium]